MELEADTAGCGSLLNCFPRKRDANSNFACSAMKKLKAVWKMVEEDQFSDQVRQDWVEKVFKDFLEKERTKDEKKCLKDKEKEN